MEKFLKDIKKRIRPTETEKERVEKNSRLLKNRLKEAIEELDEDAEVFLGGSTAKGTWLRGGYDLDFFLRFKRGKNYSERLKKICEETFDDFKKIPGSRNYYKIIEDGVEVEVVPVKYIEDPKEAENPMDVSPLHVLYVSGHVGDKKDEVRLLKKFLRSINCYGAETWIKGFSGYCAELLILKYGSFRTLVETMESERPKVYLDLESHYKNKEEAFKALKDSKIKGSPLVLIDPVQPNRNAAAALSYPTFARFIFNSRIFLKNPNKDFFKEDKIKIEGVKKKSKKRGTDLKIFGLKKPEGRKEKVFLAKLKKELNRAESNFKNEGFSIYSKGFVKEKDNFKVYFEFETKQLSKKKKHFGPPVWVPKENFDAFYRKWEGKVRVENVRLVTDVEREGLDEIFKREKNKLKERVKC